jgi:4-amino-4-deoxy-L-arabinose transferase-like glycosyltransferase
MQLKRQSRHPGAVLLLLAILAVAAALRLRGIAWGLPHAYHPDEGSILVHALGFGTGDLNPHWFRWPSLFMYVVSGLYGVFFGAGTVLGDFSSSQDVLRQYVNDPTAFWLIGRIASVVLGVATVWVTHRFARRAFGEPAALAAAAFMAVMFLHVRDSHYATPDVASTFLAAVSLLVAHRAIEHGSREDLLFSAVFAGLAASAKYTGGVAIAGTAAAWISLVRVRAAGWRTAAGIVGGLVAGFVIGTPFSVLAPREFARDVLTQFTMVSTSGVAQEGSSFADGFREVFARSIGNGIGWPIVVLAVLGAFVPARFLGGSPIWSGDDEEVAHALRDRRVAAGGRLVASWYALAVVVFALVITVKRSTYLTPALPAVAALAGAGLDGVLAAAFGATSRTPSGSTAAAARRGPVVAFVALAVALAAGAPSFLFGEALTREDTRSTAARWIERNVPPGVRVAVEYYGPELNPTEAQLRTLVETDVTVVSSWEQSKRRLSDLRLEAGSARQPQFEVYGIGWWENPYRLPAADEAPDELAAAVERLGIRVVVLSSKAAPGRPMEGAEPPSVEGPQPFVDWLASHAVRAARFAQERPAPFIDRGPGRSFHDPVIEVYVVQGGRGEGLR